MAFRSALKIFFCVFIATSSSSIAEEPAAPPGQAQGAKVQLAKNSSGIYGLLVSTLSGGKFAGAASHMHAIAVPSGDDQPSALKFNQATGPMMTEALEEVRKYMIVRHGDWPTGKNIDISFEDKWTPKDGPSAAVACALLLEGLYTGTDWDSTVAVTGDMNSDGAVRRVGGVSAKLRGAVGRGLKIAGVPAGNAEAVRDYALMDGPDMLLKIQVLGLKTFEDARALARPNREAKLAGAIADFNSIMTSKPAQTALGSWIRTPAVIAKLHKITTDAPNHISAAIVLEFAESRGAGLTLSLAGSIAKIDVDAAAIIAAIPQAKSSKDFTGLNDDLLGGAVMRIRRERVKCHPETVKVIDSLADFGTEIRALLKSPPRYAPAMAKAVEKIQAAAAKVDTAYSNLRNNPAVREELMKE